MAYLDNNDRLVELKNEWDPENLFRLNQNIGRLSESVSSVFVDWRWGYLGW